MVGLCPVTGIVVKYGFSIVMDIRWVDATICRTGCLGLTGISKGGSMGRFNDVSSRIFPASFFMYSGHTGKEQEEP